MAALDLVAVLLFVVCIEFALNRLAVSVLRPRDSSPVPDWHRSLDALGLFVFHLASVLAIGVAGFRLWRATRQKGGLPLVATATVAAFGTVFICLAAWTVLGRHPEGLSFHLETAFFAFVVLLWLSFAMKPADLYVKIGLALLLVPFAVHYYGTLTLRLSHGLEPWQHLPHVRALGNWALTLCALAIPLCFAPRPWRRAFARPGPVALSAFAATVGAIILRRHFDVGMELASRGLGVEFGPAEPPGTIALYVLALGAITWTLAATLTAQSAARRRIGTGFALIVLAGYAFTWPLQLVAGAVGVMAILEGGMRVADEEKDGLGGFKSPPIEPAIWQRYTQALVHALSATIEHDQEDDREMTILRGTRDGHAFSLRMERQANALCYAEIVFGPRTVPQTAPVWTLHARPESRMSIGQHPHPPSVAAPIGTTGDVEFDRRFRVRDSKNLSSQLLTDATRTKAMALLDGWIAVWPGALAYRVHPGRGAPLDHPVPISELAFRGTFAASAAEKFERLVALLGEIAAAAGRSAAIVESAKPT